MHMHMHMHMCMHMHMSHVYACGWCILYEHLSATSCSYTHMHAYAHRPQLTRENFGEADPARVDEPVTKPALRGALLAGCAQRLCGARRRALGAMRGSTARNGGLTTAEQGRSRLEAPSCLGPAAPSEPWWPLLSLGGPFEAAPGPRSAAVEPHRGAAQEPWCHCAWQAARLHAP